MRALNESQKNQQPAAQIQIAALVSPASKLLLQLASEE